MASFELTKSITDKYQIDPYFAYAVATVESNNEGFDKKGIIKMRFEPHIFRRYMRNAGRDCIINPNDYSRSAMLKAKEIDEEFAYYATSYGLYQIMGFNFKAAGYPDVNSYVRAMIDTEDLQISAFCEFVKNANLEHYIKNKLFTKFAYLYNGPNYESNQYDVKLETAYKAAMDRFNKDE